MRVLFRSLIKIILASLVMGLSAYYLYHWLSLFLNQAGILNQIICLGLAILAAVLIYFLLIRWLGIREMNEVLESFKKRFFKNQI